MSKLQVQLVTPSYEWILGDFGRRLVEHAPADIEVTVNRTAVADVQVHHWMVVEEAVNQPDELLARSIITVQSWCERVPKRSLAYRRPALERCAAIVCVNTSYIRALELAGIHGARLILLAVDHDIFKPPNARPGCMPGKGDKFTVGICGRYYPEGYKGDEARRRIMERLKDEAVFVFMGSRWEETEIPWAEAQGIQTQYFQRGHVQWPRDFVAIYQKLHAYLVTSRYEGGPAPPLEALACGCPVVATPVGRMPDIIVPDVNGSVIPFLAAGDHEMDDGAAADALRRWARSPVDPRTIASTVRQYTWEYWEQSYYSLYREVADRIGGEEA